MANEIQNDSLGRSSQERVERCSYLVTLSKSVSLKKDYNQFNWKDENKPETFALMPFVVSIQLHESLDVPFKYGELYLKDVADLKRQIPLTGNEIITITTTSENHSQTIKKDKPYTKIAHYKIFDISHTQNDYTANIDPSQAYLKIDLVEFPFFDMFFVNSVHKTWNWDKGVSVSKAVKDISESVNYFTDWYELDIESTKESETIQFYSPYWTPIKCVNYLNRFAVSSNTNPFYYLKTLHPKEGKKPTVEYKSVYTKFTETKTKDCEVYGTVLLENLIQMGSGNKSEVAIQAKLKDTLVDGLNYDSSNNIIKYGFQWGSGERVFANNLGETLVNFNHQNSQFNYFGYDRAKHMEIYKSIDVYMSDRTDVSKTVNGHEQWTRFRSVPWREEHNIRNLQVNNFWKKTLKNNVICNAVTYFNERRIPGEKSFLMFESSQQSFDPQMSGPWICWEVTDVIDGSGISNSFVKFVKDSFGVDPAFKGYLEKLNNVIGQENINTIRGQ